MFGLPILRKKSDLEFPVNCQNPPCGSILTLANPLAEMRGNHFTIGVADNWTDMLGWGKGSYSSWGNGVLGFSGDSNYPKKATINRAYDSVSGLPEKSRIVKVRSMGGYTFILTDRGYLYATGNTNEGFFNYSVNNKPIASCTKTSYDFVADNVSHFDVTGSTRYGYNGYVLIVKNDGKVYGLGGIYNAFGLGNVNKGAFYSLTYLGIDNAAKVFCTNPDNQGKSFVLKKDGTVWSCGYNTSGCLGVNSNDSIVYTWTKVQKRDTEGGVVSDLTGVINVITSNFMDSAGANGYPGWGGAGGSAFMTTYFLTNSGYVYTCGNNTFGQLGLGLGTSETRNVAQKTSITNATKIATAAGGTSILVATSNNTLYSWGNNNWGQLGTNDLVNKNSPTLISFPSSDLIMEINGGGQYGIILGSFVVLTNAGEVFGSGYNGTYALGITNNGSPNGGPIKTFTKNEYFGLNPTQSIDPTNPSLRAIAKGIDLCGYGSEMAQKVLTTDTILYMSGWNQNVNGVWNFNPTVGTQTVSIPTRFKLH